MVTATSNPTDPALAHLPTANVRQAGDFPEDEFVLVSNVPVFAEHTTTAKDGRQLRFGLQELQAVANRCNQRIQQSGDYAAICFGHTPSPDEDKPMPELCGYAGPFRLGKLGADNRVAILADFHIYKDNLAQFKRHPRRSPEVWLEDKYEEMFLDPIALLSSECPRLDMGLMYSAIKGGRIVEKYTAVAPAAGNVFTPSTGTSRDYAAPKFNTGDTKMNLSSDDIRGIIDALMKMDVMVEMQQLLTERRGANTSTPGGLEGLPEPDATAVPPSPPAPAETAPLGPEPGGESLAGMEGPESTEPPMPPGPPAPAAPPMSPAAPPEEEEPKKFAANEQGPYQDATDSEISSGEEVEHDLGSPRKYAAEEDLMDDMDDDEFEDYARQRRARRRKKYEADGSVEPDNSQQPGKASVEPDSPGPSGSGSVDGSGSGESTGEYQESDGKEVVKFRRESTEILKLRKEVSVERGKRIDAERYSALSSAAELYTLDPAEEIATCDHDHMNDRQFAEHLERIKLRYQRRPIAHYLPTHHPDGTKAAAHIPDRPGNARARETYSKAISDKAFKICVDRQLSGEDVSYPEILEQVAAGTLKE